MVEDDKCVLQRMKSIGNKIKGLNGSCQEDTEIISKYVTLLNMVNNPVFMSNNLYDMIDREIIYIEDYLKENKGLVKRIKKLFY